MPGLVSQSEYTTPPFCHSTKTRPGQTWTLPRVKFSECRLFCQLLQPLKARSIFSHLRAVRVGTFQTPKSIETFPNKTKNIKIHEGSIISMSSCSFPIYPVKKCPQKQAMGWKTNGNKLAQQKRLHMFFNFLLIQDAKSCQWTSSEGHLPARGLHVKPKWPYSEKERKVQHNTSMLQPAIIRRTTMHRNIQEDLRERHCKFLARVHCCHDTCSRRVASLLSSS